MKKVIVRFDRSYDRYNAGEEAAFSPEMAQRLEESGMGSIVGAAAKKKPAPEPEAAPKSSARKSKSKGKKGK